MQRSLFIVLCGFFAAAALAADPGSGPAEWVNSLGMRFLPVRAGSFLMGEQQVIPDELIDPLTYPTRSELRRRFPEIPAGRFQIPSEYMRHGDYDERPVHRVSLGRPFFMAATEVTNAQYEQFDPGHRALRGKHGFAKGDAEAVVFVTWQQATDFCTWLSRKEGRPYRLPTEAEWEYAARAGTTTLFSTGDRLPAAFLNNARSTEFDSPEDVVSLEVGRTPPNPWGFFDLHGNVEEWTADWYGPYRSGEQKDPVGPDRGDFRVSRGGSHGSDPYYLRSANRLGSLPETASWLIGFRVVQGERPKTRPFPPAEAGKGRKSARDDFKSSAVPPDPNQPFFKGPRQYVKISPEARGPVFFHHNHDTAVSECPNGDLLAIWYTCAQERGRELAVASSRLRRGAEEWEAAAPFWDAPDRNDHCPALWYDGEETLYHFNGLGVAGKWEPLAILMRTSTDSGVTWSRARLIVPEFGLRNMVGEPVLQTRGGNLLFGADAQGGSTIWVSRDRGVNWSDPGGTIRGVHAGIVELRDGRLMALGRGQNMDGWMPMSLSADMGRTWTARPSVLPPIGGGQRLVLLRLEEGPLFLASFAKSIERFMPAGPGERDERGLTSLFVALSFDEGLTWPVRRVVSDGLPEHAALTIDGGRIRMSPDTAEPQGYLSVCQSRDGLIHLISSINHYSFNSAWIRQGQPKGPAGPQVQILRQRELLPEHSVNL